MDPIPSFGTLPLRDEVPPLKEELPPPQEFNSKWRRFEMSQAITQKQIEAEIASGFVKQFAGTLQEAREKYPD